MKVLLVDDSEIDLMINQKIIEMTYAESIVSSLDDSEQFFEYLEQNEKPDLVISDMQMPRVTGLELANMYIQKYGESQSKIILLTAFVDDEIQKEVSAISDTIQLVEKPLNMNLLKQLVQA